MVFVKRYVYKDKYFAYNVCIYVCKHICVYIYIYIYMTMSTS